MKRTDLRDARRQHARPSACWACLGIMTLLTGAAPLPATPQVAIAAFLLSSETGRLSADAVTHPELLGNAVSGAASGHAALVRIRVASGPGHPLLTNARVRLVAIAAGGHAMAGGAAGGPRRVVLDRTVRLGPAGADGNAYAGFWLDDVGCEPIALDATLLTAAKPPHGHADLGFQCYE